MPPLKNIKHEAFARDVVTSVLNPESKPSLTKSYQTVYSSGFDAADDHAYRLAGYGGMIQRLHELLDEAGATNGWISTRLHDLGISENGMIALGAIKEINRVRGLTDQQNTFVNNQVFVDESSKRDLLKRLTSSVRKKK